MPQPCDGVSHPVIDSEELQQPSALNTCGWLAVATFCGWFEAFCETLSKNISSVRWSKKKKLLLWLTLIRSTSEINALVCTCGFSLVTCEKRQLFLSTNAPLWTFFATPSLPLPPPDLPLSEHMQVECSTWLPLNVVSNGNASSSSQAVGVTKIAKSVIAPLAEQHVSVFMLSTYQTDFILVRKWFLLDWTVFIRCHFPEPLNISFYHHDFIQLVSIIRHRKHYRPNCNYFL